MEPSQAFEGLSTSLASQGGLSRPSCRHVGPCHGSKFDLAGRVYKGAPAPVNLEVPPHMYVSDSTILIGADQEGA